mmetsp:Transcript_116062/g.339343  ORF Transcript_116062/g.339343 Transcript_116062/m.339343 type:complete len:233 (-) Transcript_116062:299-997(-)
MCPSSKVLHSSTPTQLLKDHQRDSCMRPDPEPLGMEALEKRQEALCADDFHEAVPKAAVQGPPSSGWIDGLHHQSALHQICGARHSRGDHASYHAAEEMGVIPFSQVAAVYQRVLRVIVARHLRGGQEGGTLDCCTCSTPEAFHPSTFVVDRAHSGKHRGVARAPTRSRGALHTDFNKIKRVGQDRSYGARDRARADLQCKRRLRWVGCAKCVLSGLVEAHSDATVQQLPAP